MCLLSFSQLFLVDEILRPGLLGPAHPICLLRQVFGFPVWGLRFFGLRSKANCGSNFNVAAMTSCPWHLGPIPDIDFNDALSCWDGFKAIVGLAGVLSLGAYSFKQDSRRDKSYMG